MKALVCCGPRTRSLDERLVRKLTAPTDAVVNITRPRSAGPLLQCDIHGDHGLFEE